MLVLEQGTELVMDRIQVLLKHLSDVTIVTRDQLIAVSILDCHVSFDSNSQ